MRCIEKTTIKKYTHVYKASKPTYTILKFKNPHLALDELSK